MHRTVCELVEVLTPEEFAYWVAHGRIRAEEMEAEREEAKREAARTSR